jgi:hypothetical protein
MLGVLLLSACTDPAAIGPPPLYITLSDIGNVSLTPPLLSRIPSDSCPPFAAPTTPTVRRAIPGGDGASIAMSTLPGILETALTPEAGLAFRLPNEGHVIVTFDTKLPYVDRTPLLPIDLGIFPFASRWCTVSVGGRTAFLYLNKFVADRLGRDGTVIGQEVQFFNQMLVVMRSDSGRNVFVTIVGDDRTSFQLRDQSTALRLLAYAASVQW